jgi:hypothetical protein
MQARAAEARRLRNLPPAPALAVASPDERLALVVEQIGLTRKALNNGCDPKDRAQLLRGLCALLDRERILRGEPLPGSRKPAPERVQRQTEVVLQPTLATPQPITPQPVAQPVVTKPLGWEYDDPNATQPGGEGI